MNIVIQIIQFSHFTTDKTVMKFRNLVPLPKFVFIAVLFYLFTLVKVLTQFLSSSYVPQELSKVFSKSFLSFW